MYGVGIDLGTSFAAAAIGHAGTLDMVRLDGQSTVTPAVAYLDGADGLLTGEAADRLGLADPGRVAREFKRRLGDPTPVILGGTPYSPAALMAALLRAVLDTVTEDREAPPDHVVLTHPAVWGAYRREHFATIPRLAGLAQPGAGPTVVTTTEPVAAATYYCATHPLPPAGLLAVYDLGGGTFDSAVVRNGRDGLEIVGTPEGIEWLGGTDFDQAILDQVDRQLGGAIGRLDPGDPGTAPLLAALHRECTLAKEALSTRPQADVTVSLPDGVRHVTIGRETFEQMITPALDTTVEAFRRTLTASGITPQELTAVLLVGGSSQIPRVTELLRDTLRRPILINTHPKHAVALGAAMLSADALARRDAPAGRRPGRRGTPVPAAVATAVGAATDPETPAADAGTAAPAAGGGWRSRRILVPAIAAAVVLVLVVLLVIVPKLAGGGTPGCGGTDAALHRPALASSTEGAGYPASSAVDGVGTTRWSSEFSDPQWLQVDLGTPVAVCGVRIDWESAYASAFQLQLSPDAVNWTTVYATAAGTGATQRLTVSGTGRYVRLYLTGRATGYGYSLWEFAVFTTGTVAPTTAG